MTYLDYAAATPIDKKVLAAMQPYLVEKFYNPSAAYGLAREVRADYEDARHRIASVIGAKPTEIIITAGATESTNLAFNVPRVKKSKILLSAIEHKAVLAVATRETLFTRVGLVGVDKKGSIDFDDLENQISDETILISIGYANSEIGTVQDIRKISKIVAKVRDDRLKRGIKTPLLFHTDASQAAGLLDINVARLGVDMMTLSAGKCYGPKQVGLLYVRTGVRLEPLIVGGGQESGLRSGTENVAGVVGFAKAIEIAEAKRKSEVKRQGEIRKKFINFLKVEFPDIVINGNAKHCLPGLVSFSIPGLDAERALYALDQNGIQVATGAACDANRHSKSHVLAAIGLDDELINGSIRVSIGRDTDEKQIEEIKPIFSSIIKEQLKFGGVDE